MEFATMTQPASPTPRAAIPAVTGHFSSLLLQYPLSSFSRSPPSRTRWSTLVRTRNPSSPPSKALNASPIPTIILRTIFHLCDFTPRIPATSAARDRNIPPPPPLGSQGGGSAPFSVATMGCRIASPQDGVYPRSGT